MLVFALTFILLCFVPHTHGRQDIVGFGATKHSVLRDSKTGIYFANFLEAKFKLLNVVPLKVMFVKSKCRCKYECLKDERCYSYNIAVLSNSVGEYQCQILDKEMVSSSHLLASNESFNHYSIKSSCTPPPCVNQEKCIPHLNNNSHTCKCDLPYYGEVCNITFHWSQWLEWTPWMFVNCHKNTRTRTRTTCIHAYLDSTHADCGGQSSQSETKSSTDPTSGCDNPLGIGNQCIHDDKMTANRRVNSNNLPQYGRLNLVRGEGGWTGNYAQDWLQVDLSTRFSITGFATQGRARNPTFTKTLQLKYSNDMSTWLLYHTTHSYVFQANVDHLTAVKTVLPKGPVEARGVRFVALTFSSQPALRVEIYGCKL